MNPLLVAAVELVGALLIVAGVGLLSIPVALIAAGAFCLAGARQASQ